MTRRSRTGVHRILEYLGSSVLDVAAAEGDLDAEVTGVHIHDPADEPLVPPGALVLGVGVVGARQLRDLLGAAEPGAALVVKHPVEVDDEVRAVARRTRTPVLGLNRSASWSHVAALIRSMLDEDGPEAPDDPPDDLFTLANAVCALLDAPITIEDRACRVLAYSERQDEADAPRVETILGRQVPEHLRQLMDRLGTYRELYKSREPVYIQHGDIHRTAVAVRSGDEILGSIWAVTREELSPARKRALADAATIVAMRLLRIRAGADTRRRLRTELLSTVLAGGAQAVEAAGRLGVSGGCLCVLAAQLVPEAEHEDPVRAESERQRFGDALALHLGTIHPRSAAALIGSVAYAILPAPAAGDAGQRAVRVAEDFLHRVGHRYAANIGVGLSAAGLIEVARSRADADRALRVLRSRRASGAVAAYPAVQFESLLLQLGDLAAAEGQRPRGPYQLLLEHDAGHGSDLAGTLRAYLEAFGDVVSAAAAMEVHANTFRYRLKRAVEVSGIELNDHRARLHVMLQMEIFTPPPRDRDVSW
ncbi:helix-turn-helix domain-containing protein [Nonomuraea typhae]|uniref:helix-turn-helix domain-containing protein n=1 Tax=Nonomuraea typhae TaxID=2603600 RepID=UPI0012FC06FE|nr:helix-turn-helix domain-containing protein [Nonomuraea typhae]